MSIPTTALGIFALISLLIPGIVFAAVRTALQGFTAHDRSISSRVVQAVMISVLFDSLYLVLFGSMLGPIFAKGSAALLVEPQTVGICILALGILIPGLVAYLIYGQSPWHIVIREWVSGKLPKWVRLLSPQSNYKSVPTAWDWAAPTKTWTWIRVLNAHGKWTGGRYTDEAFFSVYPEPRDIFIPEQWDMKADGSFVRMTAQSAGVWLSLEDAQVVEWLYDSPEAGSNQGV